MAASPLGFFNTTEVRIRDSKSVDDGFEGKDSFFFFYTRLLCL